jgi:fructose-bisphosphate aldolase, class II
MPIVTLKEILTPAVSGNYAVGAFDTVNQLYTEAIIDAAEGLGTPVILMCVDELITMSPPKESWFRYFRDMADEAKVPVCLLLDHGKSFETCRLAVKRGFSSVMFDGSLLPYAENVRQTRKIVEMAKAAGLSVEAEIGHVGGLEGSALNNPDGSYVDKSGYTRPDDAVRFIDETGVDALAIAFGTVHGIFKEEPRLDFDRISIIRSMTNLPLVMHGGSGVSADDFRTAVKHGINKVNIFTGMSLAGGSTIREAVEKRKNDRLHFESLCKTGENAVRGVVEEHIRIFGTKSLGR